MVVELPPALQDMRCALATKTWSVVTPGRQALSDGYLVTSLLGS